MIAPIIFRPEAEQDVVAARAWYEQQRQGLGAQFTTRLSEIIETIGERPNLYASLWENVRAVQLRKFPYVVYYRVQPDHVEILAVLHGRRDPSIWMSRVQ